MFNMNSIRTGNITKVACREGGGKVLSFSCIKSKRRNEI